MTANDRAKGAGITIRALRYTDVDAIGAIDRTVTMNANPRRSADLWSLVGESTTSFGAERDGALVGFVLADVRPWEFGAREAVGWILAVGVHPDEQARGAGRLLAARVLEEFRKLGVRHASTLVEKDNARLLLYFERIGFKPAGQVALEMRL